MIEVYYDGIGNPYFKPEKEDQIYRDGAYALIYIKDIDSFVITEPKIHINEDVFKMVGGGAEKSETILITLKREFKEETDFSINEDFKLLSKLSYNFNLAATTINKYYSQRNTYFLYEINSLKEAGMPNKSWISYGEKLTIKVIKKDVLIDNPLKIHFSQRAAFKFFINVIFKKDIMKL